MKALLCTIGAVVSFLTGALVGSLVANPPPTYFQQKKAILGSETVPPWFEKAEVEVEDTTEALSKSIEASKETTSVAAMKAAKTKLESLEKVTNDDWTVFRQNTARLDYRLHSGWSETTIRLGNAVLRSVVSWPGAAILALLLFAGRLLPIAQLPIRRLKFGEAELELGQLDESTAATVRASTVSVLREYRQAATGRLEELMVKHHIAGMARTLLERSLPAALEAMKPGLGPSAARSMCRDVRLTIHVLDLVFADHLVQAIDYVGANPPDKPGGRGRAFSMGFGVIGRAWRSQASRVIPKMEQDLRGEYGIDETRVSHGRDTGAMAAIILDAVGTTKTPVAVIYLDHPQPRGFLPPDSAAANDEELAKRFIEVFLQQVPQDLRTKLTMIDQELSAYRLGIAL